MKKKNGRVLWAMSVLLLPALLAGCSRSQMNYQIADAIGTAGLYENNEPVETPQMAEIRKAKEESEKAENELQSVLEKAATLALGYKYDEALALLDTITGEQAQDERVLNARSEYEQGVSKFVAWEGDIPHLCFPVLVEDSMRAFDGDERSSVYSSGMVTTDEFKSILQSLYDENYILIDIHSIAAPVTDDRGTTTVENLELKLPPGKKPIVLSQDNLNYSDVKNGDGIATRLALDDSGKVKACYTDDGGHDLTGDYDFIPILDSFIEEHPDFSFNDARGIVSVSGSKGVFGYDLPEEGQSGAASASEAGTGLKADLTDDQKMIANISKALTDEGWHIACAGWSHSSMNEMSSEAFCKEIDRWLLEVGSLTGNTDILFYPYGAEVAYPGSNLDYLLSNGFMYLCGLWGNTDYREVTEKYMRMTRRFVDGYTLMNAPDYFLDFFVTATLLDEDR